MNENSEKELLKQDLNNQENPEEIKKFIEDVETMGENEDVVELAKKKLEEILAKANTIEKTSESQISQIESLSGSTSEIEKRTEGVDKQIEEVKTKATEEIEKVSSSPSEQAILLGSQTKKELEDESADFVKQENFSSDQKAYLDQTNLLKEKLIEKDNKIQEHKGSLEINGNLIKIEDFIKDPQNIKNLDFTNIYNTSNIDLLLENGIKPEEIFEKLSNSLGEDRALEKVMLLPKKARDIMYASVNENRKLKDTAKKLGIYFGGNSARNKGNSKFTEMIKFVGLPLSHLERNDIYPNYVAQAKEAKSIFETSLNADIEKGQMPIHLISLCSKPEGISSLFRATEIKYLTREEAVKLAKESLLGAFKSKHLDFQQKIQESVLVLQKTGQISEEEASQILEAPLN